MIDIKKPVTMLEYLKGEKKLNTKRIDFLKGNQDNIWKASDQKATKEELTQAREDMETQIADKADASDITTINETLAGKAEQSQVDSLASSVASKASQADVNTLTTEVGTKASQSAFNSLVSTVNTKASQTDLNTANGKIETLETESATKEELEESYEKTRMRNENLITNGFGELGDNTNFSDCEYDSTVVEGEDTSIGAFTAIGKKGVYVDEYIPVDPKKMYDLSFRYKNFAVGTQNNFLFGIGYYTADKSSIASYRLPAPGLDEEEYYDGCELAQEFNTATDLVIYLKTGHAQKWVDRYNKAKNHPTLGSKCYTYLARISSKISTSGRDYGFVNMDFYFGWTGAVVDVVNDTITLATLASSSNVGSRVFPAGTKLDSTSYSDQGSAWYYGTDYTTSNEWKLKTYKFSDNSKKWAIRPTTAYIRLLWLVDWGGSTTDGVVSAISSVTFKPLYTNPDMVSEQIETERPDSAYKNSNIVESDIPALPQSKITNLTTDLAAKASNSALSTAVADLSSDIAEKASNDDLDDTNTNVTALQTSKADKTDLANLEGVVSTKASQTALNTLSDEVDNKASVSALARTTNMDIYSNANLQSFIIGPAYSTATAFCTELGLFLEVRTPVWLAQTKLFMKDADNVLVQLYNYENDVVIYEKSFSLGANENIISLGVLLPAGRYYFSGTSDNESLAYFPTTEYSITHHFVSVFGGELDPVAFPAFMPGTTNQWAGFYQMTFQVPFKALYLGLLSAKEPNANLIQGAFYHVNDSNYLRTWCFDGTTQISN
jgi:hypothetical protein